MAGILSLGVWPSGPRKNVLWVSHSPAACTPTAYVCGVAAVKLGRSTLADAVREGTPQIQA